MENFEQQLAEERKAHWKWLVTLSALLIVVWVIRNTHSSHALVDNPYAVMAMEYMAMLGTGFAIWYGYHNYSKTANILKPKDDLAEKQEFYIKEKHFQNKLIYIVFAADIVALALTFKEQFAFTSAIAAIFCAIGFPSQERFEADFIEPEYDGEQFEPEFGKQHQNDIKSNFEGEN